jgi:amidase
LASLRTGAVSASEVVSAHLAALHNVDAATNAVAWFDDERVLADARALDQIFMNHTDRDRDRGGIGPLHGLPITVKDWIDVEGFPCAGVFGDESRRPSTDATVVARLRQAGAVVMAKTKAWGPAEGDGVVLHAVDPTRAPGGSSTGEAVVVARGASPLGIGSDSGGSIRLPAAWNGVLGLKPTTGCVPTTGHFPRVGALSDGRTQIGPLARSVDVLELVLPIIAGPDWRDPGVVAVPLADGGPASLAGARFAVITSEAGWSTTTVLTDAVERAADVLVAAGLTRTEWSAPWLVDALDITRGYWARSQRTGEQAARQLWDWDRFRRHYLKAAEHIDLLLTPVTREPAPQRREIVGNDFVFTLPASLTGSPAVTVPMGPDADGLPTAVQIIARPWEDLRALTAARLITEATKP